MRIVVAPDSFKECLPAPRVASAIAEGLRRVTAELEIAEVPMADGGQGTVAALVAATGGTYVTTTVTGPFGKPVQARYGLLADRCTAVIEMAAASGLELVAIADRDPTMTTTRGTGELMLAAKNAGAKRLLLGIGGSATNDGGAGMAQALGFRLLDRDGREIGPGGGALELLDQIVPPDPHPLAQITIDVACDVTNPLTGPDGASAIYGPQKGATPEMIARLDRNLAHLATIVARDLAVDMASAPGTGAAGGLGGGLIAFAHASLRRGVDLVMDAVELRQKLSGADLCITGEGSVDMSSGFGKTAVGVAQVCRELGIPAVILAGAIGRDARKVLDAGVTAYFDVTQRPCSLEDAFLATESSLADTAEQVLRLFLAK